MPRGFAGLSEEQKRVIASQGGKAAHAQGRAHEFTPEEAREAGRKGGKTISRNREHMAAIGRLGGHMKGKGKGQRKKPPEESVDGGPEAA